MDPSSTSKASVVVLILPLSGWLGLLPAVLLAALAATFADPVFMQLLGPVAGVALVWSVIAAALGVVGSGAAGLRAHMAGRAGRGVSAVGLVLSLALFTPVLVLVGLVVWFVSQLSHRHVF